MINPTYKLTIETEDGEDIAVPMETGSGLYHAFLTWLTAEEGSSAEAHCWTRVLDEAQDYLDSEDISLDAIDVKRVELA